MRTIAVYSDNKDFYDDLVLQITKHVPEFIIVNGNALPDVAVIDNNAEVFENFRIRYKNIPLVFLFSNNCDIAENVLNISLKKPFSLVHFFDILRSANNKLDSSKDGYLSFGVYQLRPVEKEIENSLNKNVVKLTEREVSIIKYLYKFKDIFVSKNELQKNVWKYNEDVSTHTVETHIYRLRRKVEKNKAPQLILTDKGGYKLNLED